MVPCSPVPSAYTMFCETRAMDLYVSLPLYCRKHSLNVLVVMLSFTVRSLIALAPLLLNLSIVKWKLPFTSFPIHNGADIQFPIKLEI